MTGRTRALARLAASATAALMVGRVVLAITDPASSDASSAPQVPGGGVPVALFEATVLIVLALLGLVVASRRPSNPVGWILCVIPVSLALLVLASHAFWSLQLGGHEDTAKYAAWLASFIWAPAMVPALTLFPLLFPTGRPPTPRWRWVVAVAVAAAVLVPLGVAFTPGRLEDYGIENPLGVGAAAEIAGGFGFALMLVGMVAALASMVVRFRRSHGEERQQLKWVTAAAALFVVIFVAPLDKLAGYSEDVGFELLLIGLLIVGGAVAIAMLRYRLYDIDVVVNRTLVYGLLTAMLAGVYAGSVLLLQLVLSGITQGSGFAVAVSTLAVAALFGPARRRIQTAVDHRFFRRKYDAARTLEAFGGRLRNEVDLVALNVELESVVRETLQPSHVSVWLRHPGAAP